MTREKQTRARSVSGAVEGRGWKANRERVREKNRVGSGEGGWKANRAGAREVKTARGIMAALGPLPPGSRGFTVISGVVHM